MLPTIVGISQTALAGGSEGVAFDDLEKGEHPQCNCVGYAHIWANDSWGMAREEPNRNQASYQQNRHSVGMGCELKFPELMDYLSI